MELVLDLHGCNASTFNRRSIRGMCVKLCDAIDMKRCSLVFWDDVGVPVAQRQTDPKTKGTSAVQFILTSSIVIHALPDLKAAYINVFSCKKFAPLIAEALIVNWFGPTKWTARTLERR